MANAIDDTASYARVYQAVLTADKRRRSRSVETWMRFLRQKFEKSTLFACLDFEFRFLFLVQGI